MFYYVKLVWMINWLKYLLRNVLSIINYSMYPNVHFWYKKCLVIDDSLDIFTQLSTSGLIDYTQCRVGMQSERHFSIFFILFHSEEQMNVSIADQAERQSAINHNLAISRSPRDYIVRATVIESVSFWIQLPCIVECRLTVPWYERTLKNSKVWKNRT